MVKDNSKTFKHNGISKRKQWWRRRSKLEKKLIVALLITTITLLGFFLYVTVKSSEIKSPCASSGCLIAASQIISHIDPDVDPCDDFFKFACGRFIENIHGDYKAASIKTLEEQIERQVSELIQEPINENDHSTVRNQKELFQACMNETAVEEEALEIFKEVQDLINGWPVIVGPKWKASRFNWIEFTLKLKKMGYVEQSMLDVDVVPDPLDKSKRLVYISEPYVQKIKEEYKEKYKDYMTEFAIKFGADKKWAALEMENVLDFTERLREVAKKNSWDVENGNETDRNITAELLQSRFTVEEFQDQNDQIDWLRFINRMLYPVANISSTDYVIFPRNEFVEDFFSLIYKTPKKIQANYMIWKIAEGLNFLLPKKYRELEESLKCQLDKNASFPPKERFQFCKLIMASSFSPLPTNIIYARNYLPVEKKKNIQNMLHNIKSEFIGMLKETAWLDEESKGKALEKAEGITEIIGAPGDYYDDAIFDIYGSADKDDIPKENRTFFGIYLRQMKYRADATFSQINKPVNDSELEIFYHFLTRVNAMYSPEDNALVLPVGILQGIFYSPDRPEYLNYGALGSIMGHELTHGFCKDASLYDKDGKEANMWTNETAKAYEEKTKCIIQDAENYDVEDTDNTINGTLTMEENIADFTGIKTSYAAYKKWVSENGEESPLTGIDYTPYQLFWISAISHECFKLSGEKLEKTLEYDIHALNAFRATGPMRNNPDFALDFNCPQDSKMNPSEKCQVF